MKVSDKQKNRIITIIALVMAILLVAGIITATAILAKPSGSEPIGQITSADLQSVSMAYSSDTDKYFKKAFRTYFDNVFTKAFKALEIKQTASTILNPDGISELFLTAFKNARISADKVISFAYYLEKADVYDFVTNVFISSLVPVLDEQGKQVYQNGNPVYTIDERTDFGGAIAENVTPMDIIKDIVEYTSLTMEDLGKIAYQMLYNTSDGEIKSILQAMGSDGFSAVFIEPIEIVNMVKNIEQGVSLSTMRSVLQYINAEGSAITSAIARIGTSNFKKLLNGMYSASSITSESEYSDEVVASLNKVSEISPLIITIMGEAFENLTDDIVVSINSYLNMSNPDGKTYAGILISNVIYDALCNTLDEYDMTELELVGALAEVLGNVDYIGNAQKEDSQKLDLDTQIANYKTTLNDWLNNVHYLSDAYDYYKTQKDFEAISDIEKNEYAKKIDDITLQSNQLYKGVDTIASLMMLNTFVSLLPYMYA